MTDTFWGAHNCHSCHTWCILYNKFVFSQCRLIDFVGVFFYVLSVRLGQKLNILQCYKPLLFVLIRADYFLSGFVSRLLMFGNMFVHLLGTPR